MPNIPIIPTDIMGIYIISTTLSSVFLKIFLIFFNSYKNTVRIIYYQDSRNNGDITMKLSTRTRYAMRAVLELAENFGKGPLQTRVIAKNQDISVKYLEQIMASLKSVGLIRSQRGAKGGYILANPPEKIKLNDVFDVFEGPVVTVECVADDKYCKRSQDCVARHVWAKVQEAVRNVLESMTLQDIIENAKDKRSDYQI